MKDKGSKKRVLNDGLIHDFNNLMGVIVSNASLLVRKMKDAPLPELQSIRKAALEASEYIARLKRAQKNVFIGGKKSWVDINSLLTQVVDMTKPHWKDRLSRQNIRIQTALHLNKIPKIYASPTALREVFINLVLNAIDALSVKGGGTLSMKTETKEKSFHIIISDSGMGMEKGVLERALEPYFTTKGENGSGLGLSNSVEIVKNLKGTLQIQSEEGKGTTVTIALPLSKKRPKKSLTSQSLTRELSTSKHLLLVDDEEDYRRATAELLAMEGFSVEQAKNAEEALDMLKEMEPEVVLSDVRMPGMSGCDLAIQIKKKNKKTKVILVSGSKEQCKELTKKMDSYVDGWLVKPCMVEDIKQAIEQTCH